VVMVNSTISICDATDDAAAAAAAAAACQSFDELDGRNNATLQYHYHTLPDAQLERCINIKVHGGEVEIH
jgi:hypothetical protein